MPFLSVLWQRAPEAAGVRVWEVMSRGMGPRGDDRPWRPLKLPTLCLTSAEMGWIRVVLLGITAAFLAGCSSIARLPSSTQEELRAICIRDGGSWHPDGSRGGYCEYQM